MTPADLHPRPIPPCCPHCGAMGINRDGKQLLCWKCQKRWPLDLLDLEVTSP